MGFRLFFRVLGFTSGQIVASVQYNGQANTLQ